MHRRRGGGGGALGAALLDLLRNGMDLAGIDAYLPAVGIGALPIPAALADRLRYCLLVRLRD